MLIFQVSRQLVDALVAQEKIEAGHGGQVLPPTSTGDHRSGGCISSEHPEANSAAVQHEQRLHSASRENWQGNASRLETQPKFAEVEQRPSSLNPSLHTPQQQQQTASVLLRGVPAALQGGINETNFEVYRERYEQVSQGLRVWVLTRGVSAPELFARLQATPDPNTFSWTSAPVEEEQVTLQ